MTTVARGATRTVLLTRWFAVKVPALRRPSRGMMEMWCHGYLANLEERCWSSTPGVNPVLWHLGPVNVYRRCDPVLVPDDFDYAAVAPPLMGDPKPCNLGLLAGRVVWVDYA